MDAEKLFHAVVLSFLLISGIILSCLNLASVKGGKNKINANEILLMCQSILIVFGLILFMPLQIYSLIAINYDCYVFCVAVGLLETLLLESQPIVHLAIAIVCLRTYFFNGTSTALKSKSSAYITLVICLAFPVISTVVTFTSLIVSGQEKFNISVMNGNTSLDYYSAHCIESLSTFSKTNRMFTLVSLDVIPILITSSLNVIIYIRVKAEKALHGNDRERNFHKYMKCIITALLLKVTCSWIPYIYMSFYMLNATTDDLNLLLPFAVYIKMSIYILHAFFDSYLHSKRLKNKLSFHNLSNNKIEQMPYETTSASFVSNIKQVDDNDGMIMEATEAVTHTAAHSPRDDSCISIDKGCYENNAHSNSSNIHSIIFVKSCQKRMSSEQSTLHASPIGKDFDDISKISSDSSSSPTKGPMIKNSRCSSFSNESQVSKAHHACSRDSNISTISSLTTQKGRCHEHSLYHLESTNGSRGQPKSPSFFSDYTVCYKSESEISDISEYF